MSETKICTKCGVEKPATNEFYCKHLNQLNTVCKQCVNQYNKQYRVDNLERTKQYYKENADHINEYGKKYRAEHKEAVAQRKNQYYNKNIEHHKQYSQQWCKNNLERCRAKCQKRRAKKRGLPSTFNADQWEQCKQYFKNKCAYCGKILPLTQDHFVPMSKGGSYSEENIIPACLSCNSGKCDKEFTEWYPQQKFFSKKREQFIYKYLNKNYTADQISMELSYAN